MHLRGILRLLIPIALAISAPATRARELTFEQRVEAQRAIERVYYSYQIGATRPFEEAVPLATLERKVHRYLEQSAALATQWDTPVTAEMLQGEMERMARGTRFPERLQRLYAALGGDAFLVMECLARATLVDRLAREWLASDPLRGKLDTAAVRPVAREGQALVVPSSVGSCTSDDTWDNGVLDDPPGRAALHTAVWTGSKMIVWGGTLYRTGSLYDPATDSWAPVSKEGAPSPRLYHTAVWTGSRMIVWGGRDSLGAQPLNNGGVYDPLADRWAETALAGAPAPRQDAAAVWTGNRMIVWGGASGDAGPSLGTGGVYDPATGGWTATSTVNAPAPRRDATAVWTGSRMILWGGYDGSAGMDTGGIYDPQANAWTATTTAGAPGSRRDHTAVWTGSRMIVWGGRANDSSVPFNTGGVYDPVLNAWTSTATFGAPWGRRDHTAVWSGNRMIVWGGVDYGTTSAVFNTGGRYDPATNSWSSTALASAPLPRMRQTAVWTGSRMIVWGGETDESFNSTDTGGLYDPVGNAWAPTSVTDAPSVRWRHTAVWTGNLMIVWGGADYFHVFGTGGAYDPVTDHWTPTSTSGAPTPRRDHTAVWSGERMIVWGGNDIIWNYDTGGLYDPLTDTWTPTSTAGAPLPRQMHTALWTGSSMIVWGGWVDSGLVATGGRYDPVTNAWTSISTIGAASPRYNHSAVWTGNRMILWGGHGPGSTVLGSGGAYDPLTDAWSPTSMVDAPAARADHTAVWTGTRMVVWGGFHSSEQFDSGGSFDPVADVWVPTSTAGAPTPRNSHTAVWVDGQMIVWGGHHGALVLNTGARYDPSTDTWAPTAMSGAAPPRNAHTAVAIEGGMIVWGGLLSEQVNTGGRYVLGRSTGGPPPVEVSDTVVVARAGGSSLFSWSDDGIAGPFRLYRGALDGGSAWSYNQVCVGEPIAGTSVEDTLDPDPASLSYYLVTRLGCGESVAGRDSSGAPIPNAGTCP